MNKTKKVLVVAMSLLAATTLVSAALLTYFGEVNTTMTAQQSIVVGDGELWHDWDEPIGRDLGEIVHCDYICYKLWIKNQACVDAEVEFEDIPVECDPEGIEIQHFVFGDTQTIRLVQKNIVWGQSPWTELEGGMEAYLTFNTCGPTFDWTITSDCDLTGYVLIYYANYPEYWDAAPAFVIGGLSGSADIPTMPYQADENAQRPISDEGEDYEHDYGAKFWLVPAAAVNKGQINWGMAAQFLFETDLGFYLDCDDMTPEPLKNVYPIFATTILKAETTYCWISCYHVDFYIAPGQYAFDTLIHAAPVEEL